VSALDTVTECYVATSNLLAVGSEFQIYSGLVPGIAGSDTDKCMDTGVSLLVTLV
jgi:hypothetical protein